MKVYVTVKIDEEMKHSEAPGVLAIKRFTNSVENAMSKNPGYFWSGKPFEIHASEKEMLIGVVLEKEIES